MHSFWMMISSSVMRIASVRPKHDITVGRCTDLNVSIEVDACEQLIKQMNPQTIYNYLGITVQGGELLYEVPHESVQIRNERADLREELKAVTEMHLDVPWIPGSVAKPVCSV